MEEDGGVEMELPVAARVKAVPSRPAVEVNVAVVDTAAAATGAEEVGTVEAETAAATVEVVTGAEAAVAAAVDGRLRRSTRPPPEEFPRPMPR